MNPPPITFKTAHSAVWPLIVATLGTCLHVNVIFPSFPLQLGGQVVKTEDDEDKAVPKRPRADEVRPN